MKCFVLFCGVLITLLGFYVENSSQLRARQCPTVKIANGTVRPRARKRILRFRCNSPFVLVGSRYATCINGKWDDVPPICVTTGCTPVDNPENGRVEKKYDGSVLMVFCEPGYERQGPSEIYCDGIRWNDTVPTCKNTNVNPPTSCDFENPDLCLWEQHPLHDFDWVRHNYNTPSWKVGTGPSHDHTFGAGNNGYYLYTEANDKLENSTASIISPLYSSKLTEAGCFSFWYHMHGATIGTLNVNFKAEGETERRLMFTKSGNQGDEWRHGFFQLPNENTSFQIIMEGVRGREYLSDIAVDDVAILQGADCAAKSTTTTEMSSNNGYDGTQSCLGRCSDSNSTDDSTKLCQCSPDCIEDRNCCPDYLAYCVLANDTTDLNSDDSDSTTPPITPSPRPTRGPTTAGPARIPIPINPKDDIDPYPPKIPDGPNNRSGQFSSTISPRVVTKISSTTKTLTSKRPVMYPTSKHTIITPTDPTAPKRNEDDDNFDNQIGTHRTAEKNQAANRERGKVTLPGIIGIVFGAIVGVAGAVLIVFLVLQKRNSYKNSSRTSALSDDSDVRFLTSDEILDFNIAKPEDMEL